MAIQLSTHRILSWGAGLFAAYWAFGFISDPLWYSVVVSACLFVGGIMVSARAVPDALAIARKDQVGPGELAVIALALIATGAVWSGAFAIAYAHYERPQEWIGPVSAFGRAMIAFGFFVLFLSPEATRQGIRWPRWYILLTAGIIIAVVAFLMGYTFGDSEIAPSAFFDLTRATKGLGGLIGRG